MEGIPLINKIILQKQAIEQVELEIKKTEACINYEEKTMKDAPTAMQSWSDTSRNQKEDLIFNLSKEFL